MVYPLWVFFVIQNKINFFLFTTCGALGRCSAGICFEIQKKRRRHRPAGCHSCPSVGEELVEEENGEEFAREEVAREEVNGEELVGEKVVGEELVSKFPS
jgi:hypothetical protein